MAATNQIQLSEAIDNNRFSAEFFDPKFVFKPAAHSTWLPIRRILKKCEYGISISMNNEGNGYPIFRMNEIENCLAQRPEKYAAIPTSIFKRFKLCENDVLFNRTNSYEFVGRTGIVKDQTDCTFASYLIRLVPDPNVVLPEFLTIYLNTPFGIGQIKRRAMRSINQANVSGAEVKRILVPIVDIKEQQKVAKELNAAFSEIRKGEKLYADAQNLLEFELGLDKLNTEEVMGYTANFSDLELSQRLDPEYFNPVACKIVEKISAFEHIKLAANCIVKNGYPWNSKKFFEDNSGEPVVRIRNIRPTYIDIATLSSIDSGYVRSVGFPTAQKGDVVVGMDGIRYFYASILDGDCYINQRVAHLIWKANAKISPEYATFIINNKVGQAQLLRNMTIATTVGHVTNRNISNLLIPYVSDGFHKQLTELVRQSIESQKESKRLLAQTITRVEQLIEEAAKR